MAYTPQYSEWSTQQMTPYNPAALEPRDPRTCRTCGDDLPGDQPSDEPYCQQCIEEGTIAHAMLLLKIDAANHAPTSDAWRSIQAERDYLQSNAPLHTRAMHAEYVISNE